MTEEEKYLLSTSVFAIPELFDIDLKENIEKYPNYGHKVFLPKGSTFYKEGESANTVYYIQKGFVIDSLTSKDGIEQISLFFPNSLVGLVCCAHKQLAIPNSIAITDVIAYAYSFNEFLDLLLMDKILLKKCLQIEALEVRTGHCSIWHNQILSAKKRVCQILYCYATVCKYYPELSEVRMTQNMIAGLVGMHRVSVAKAIHALKEESILSVDKKGLKIENIQALKKKGFDLYI